MKFKIGDQVRVINIAQLRSGIDIEISLLRRRDLLKKEYATVVSAGDVSTIEFKCGVSGLILAEYLELASDMDADNEALLDRSALNETFAAILS